MKRRVLLTILLSLTVAIGACGDDDEPTNNTNNTNNQADVGTDDGGADDGGTDDGGTDDGGTDDGGTDDGGTDDGGTDDGGTDELNAVVADDQVLDAADSNKVVIASVTLENDGFVVIHEDNDGAPGEVIGHKRVVAGDTSDVEVELDRNVVNGETLHAMLHGDTNDNGTYDFVSAGDEDGPLLDDADAPVVDPFMVNVAEVSADDVTLSDLSTVVTIGSVYSKGAGFVVIHENACTDFGAVIGNAAVSDGANSDIEVTLERPAVDGEELCAMLHFDTGTAGEYEFDGSSGSEDAPVVLADGTVVMDTFAVTLDGNPPAVRITLSANGSQDYTVDSVEPALYDDGLSGSNDPVLMLMEGWRYEIVNTATSSHPFELLDGDAGLGGNGDVLLSQAASPGTETDPDTAWVEDGNSILFTVAGEAFSAGIGLSSQVDSYRCEQHPASMTGDVTLQSP